MVSKKLLKGWDKIDFPGVIDSTAYALEITGNSMQPVYRKGSVVIVSPKATLSKGDRVVVKTTDGQVVARQLVAKSPKTVTLLPFNHAAKPLTVKRASIDWLARIIWASQ